ncbi:MAG: hypothetical protein NTW51_12565 [Cyanobacteria bacterium]|nr:hypothetical protein [Cyanobacteriota bacterium]
MFLEIFSLPPWWNALWEPLLLLWEKLLWEKSFECPLAGFCPPFVQVLGATWLGLPDERLKDLLSVFAFDKTGGRWPYETITILVLVILSTIYGAEYGYRLQTALSLAATDTRAQSARTDAEARDRDAEKDQLELRKSLIRNQIAAIEDPVERNFILRSFLQSSNQALTANNP